MEEKPSKKTEICQNCGERGAVPEHSCPYAEEILNNYESVCNCCDYCAYQCCMDI